MTETFCIKCGSKLDKETGLCPRCDADKISQQYVEKIVKPAQDAQKIAETVNKEDEKKKARNMISKHKTGWEIKRFIVVMLCLVLVAGIALCVLTYFNILDVPAISTIMENVGINEILKNGKSDSSNISIKINDTIKATSYGNDLEWYEAYRQVLNNADLYKPDSSNCVAFRDMDQDGVPELFINVCASNAMEYNLQVWTYKEGKASLAGNMQVGITTAGWNTYIFGMDDGNICRKTVEGNDYIEQVSYEYYKLNGVSLMKTKTDEIICDNVQRNTDGYESDVYLNGAYICTTNNDGNELWDKIAEFADHVQTLMASIYTDKSCDQYTRVDMSESDATAYLDSQSKKIARSEIYENLNTTSIGDIVTFGSYEQDNNTSNGKEAIEWIVIDKNGTGALLLSKYALDCRKYNSETTDVTWGTCTLRNWLNEAFFDNAFNEMEKSKIKTTVVMADKNPDYDTNAGADTADKVFLLSIKEIEKYFNTDEERMCAPTEYAIANGAFITDLYSVDGKVTCGWWLRSPGDVSDSAAGIDCDGWIGISGIDVSNDMGCVRPALWVELENEVEIAASEDYLEKTTENEVSEENLLTRVTVSGNVTNAIFKEYSYEDIIKHWAIWDDSIWGIHSELDLFDNCEWILEYDDTGNLISETWNDNYNNTGVMNYTYDDNGNLLTETAIRNGIITHRLTIERDSSGKKISQITETSPESDVGYSIKLQYDEYENVVRSENGQSGVLWTYDRTYDDNGNPLSVMWRQFMPVDDVEPNAMSTTIYEYDSNGKLLKEVVQNDYLQVSETTYTRTEDGKPLTRDYQDNYRGNNTYTEWEYDDAGNLISITQNDDYNGTSVESYDGDGNLLRYTDEDKTTEYSYDEKGNQTEVICTYKEESNKNYTIWREFYEDGTKKTEHLTGATSNGIYYQRQCEWNQKGCLLEVCITSPYVSEQLDIVFEYGSQNTSNSYTYAAEGITWNFDESSDTLTISGNGAIVDYSDRKIQPWKNYKSNIKHIVVEDGVTSIGDGAFEEYTSLESVSISGDVSTIGKRAFWNCTNLAYLYLGEGIIEIHDQAFGNCDKLISLVIPNSVTFLGYAAFQSCDQLENITFGSGLTCIGISAFSEEPCLESITVPENVVTIDDGAFCNCENLSNVTLCEGIESIGEVAFAGTNINTLTIPGTVVSIGYEAFCQCNALEYVVIEDGVEAIEEGAFYCDDNLRSIVIPASITFFGKGMFSNAETAIYYGGSEEQWKELGYSYITPVVYNYNGISEGNQYETSLTVKTLDASELPDGLTEFLLQFDFSYFEQEYDCNNLDDIFDVFAKRIAGHPSAVKLSLYPGGEAIESWDGGRDPLGRYDEYVGYISISVEKYYWVAENVFNISRETANAMLNTAATADPDFYLYEDEGGLPYICSMLGGVGGPDMYISYEDIRYDGEKYYIVYDYTSDSWSDSWEPEGYVNKFYTEMEYKETDGIGYWSMYRHTKNIPTFLN